MFLVISATLLRELITLAIPDSLRIVAAAGIGLLLTFLGLQNAGMIVSDPATLVQLRTLDHRAVFLVLGLLVAVLMMRRGNPLAFLSAIAVATAGAWTLGLASPHETLISAPDFSSVFLELDVWGALRWTLVPAILTLLFTDLFDSLSTFLGVARVSGLTDARGRLLRLRQGLIVDAATTMLPGLVGTSPGTAYVESVAGIRMGGRTGRASVVTALCFLPCLFVAPLAAAVPAYATAPVLVLVGVSMFQTVRYIPFERIEDALPAFVTLTLIPLTFSITQGIIWGFILHVLLYTVAGRRREVPATLWALAAIAMALLVIEL